MQLRYSDRFIFVINLGFAIVATALFAMTFVAAEVYVTNGHMLADVETANGSISVAIAIAK
jgi:hypothetical protein